MSRIRFPRPLGIGIIVLVIALLSGLDRPARAAHPLPSPDDDPLTAADVSFVLRYGAVLSSKRARDRWVGRDKAKHVIFSALWTLSTQYVLVNKVGWTERRALPASIASGVAIGVTKEIYDAQRPQRTASEKDLVANAVGIGLAATIIAL